LLFCARAAHILSAIDPATGKPLDNAHAKGEMAIFMAAGFETTSHAITWCLTMLVRLLLFVEYQCGAV
jgi:cytochrome P450